MFVQVFQLQKMEEYLDLDGARQMVRCGLASPHQMIPLTWALLAILSGCVKNRHHKSQIQE